MQVKQLLPEQDCARLSFIIDVYDNNPLGLVYKKMTELKNINSLTLQQVLEDI